MIPIPYFRTIALILALIMLISGLILTSLRCRSNIFKERSCSIGLALFSIGIVATVPLVVMAVAKNSVIKICACKASGVDANNELSKKTAKEDFAETI
ncbi:hypothetical protein TSMEX_000405 [Taenia solium]|eukprot:TsM_000440400 transcript=TsM_000440400 gene=TsM_000440400